MVPGVITEAPVKPPVTAIAIGSSTGGPRPVQHVLSGLGADIPGPIFLAQHMPPAFTKSYAASLDQSTALSVVHAEDGMPVFPGVVYVGRGRMHMSLRQRLSGAVHLVLSTEPKAKLYMPSADVLFDSAARIYRAGLLAVVMTGMGRDGEEGAGVVKAHGGRVITQEEKSCAVYGMPHACVEAGLSDMQLTPEQLRSHLQEVWPSGHRHPDGASA